MNRTIAHLNAATVSIERLAAARSPILLTVAGWVLCAAVFATQSHFAAAVRGQSVPWGAAFAAWLV